MIIFHPMWIVPMTHTEFRQQQKNTREEPFISSPIFFFLFVEQSYNFQWESSVINSTLLFACLTMIEHFTHEYSWILVLFLKINWLAFSFFSHTKWTIRKYSFSFIEINKHWTFWFLRSNHIVSDAYVMFGSRQLENLNLAWQMN